MSTFTIDAENNITAFAVLPTGTDESQSFSTAKELAKLTAVWPVSRLIDTWNSFAGVAPFDELKPVKKFTSRKSAVTRIWQAIARLSPDGAQTAAPVATAKRLSPDGAQTAAPVATAKGKAKKTPAKAPRRARAQKGAEERGNKKAEVITMMKRAKGATLAEIMAATKWQAHTVRGFVSILGSKVGKKIESSKSDAGERTYKIAK
jgi:hypothetical protein